MAGDAAFDGARRTLLGLLFRNYLLGLITLGIYRFWAKTAVRRYFWGHVSLAGERLEYTGRPIELLIGLLRAVVVLAPVVGMYT